MVRMLERGEEMDASETHMETQLEIDTMNAVPTPRFEVGENTFAAQLLWTHYIAMSTRSTHIN